MRTKVTITLLLSLLTLSSAVYANSIVIGTTTGQNYFPFGHNSSVGTRYQQAYDAADFSGLGIISITGIDFFRYSAGSLYSGDYTISLSTITAGINTLSNTNFDGNLGPNNTVFATVSLSGAMPSTLSFVGGPFLYDSSAGNLLLDIKIANGVNNSSPGFYNAMNGDSNGVFSRYHNFGAATIGYGLVTQFDYGPAIPEPTSLLLLGTGLGVLGFAAWRRKK